MYSEPFKFEFHPEIKDSERMNSLVELFQLSEKAGIKRESYGGYKIQNNGTVEFWSYDPALTKVAILWLKQSHVHCMVSILKPKSLKNA